MTEALLTPDAGWLALFLSPVVLVAFALTARGPEPFDVRLRAWLTGALVSGPAHLAWISARVQWPNASLALDELDAWGLSLMLTAGICATLFALAFARSPYLTGARGGVRFGAYLGLGLAGGAALPRAILALTTADALMTTLTTTLRMVAVTVVVGAGLGQVFGAWREQGRLGEWSRRGFALALLGGVGVAALLSRETAGTFRSAGAGAVPAVLVFCGVAALVALLRGGQEAERPRVGRRMQCSRCGSFAEPGSLTCGACRAAGPSSPFVLRCGACRRTIEPADRFCGACGAGLAGITQGAASRPAEARDASHWRPDTGDHSAREATGEQTEPAVAAAVGDETAPA